MNTPAQASPASSRRTALVTQALLIGYAVVLPIRGTAALQSSLLIMAFVLLLAERRGQLATAWGQARWLLGPLLIFSLWIFATCGFWREPPLHFWDPSTWDMRQPWFSLNQWRRDIAQPMLAMLCGFWVFRGDAARRRLFVFQGILLAALLGMALWQFYLGERLGDGSIYRGTLQVRGFSRDNIFFSYVLLMLTPAALWLVAQRRGGWRSALHLAFLLALLYLVFLNKRRGTWMALWVELAILTAWFGRRRLLIYLAITLIAGAAAWQVRPAWFQREYDTQDVGRIQIWRAASAALMEKPLLGVGFGKDTVAKNYWSRMYQHAHNTFLNMALAVGWPGVVLWIGALGVYARRFWGARHQGWGPRIAFAFLVAFCVRNLMDDIWLSSNAELFWFLLGVFMPARGVSQVDKL